MLLHPPRNAPPEMPLPEMPPRSWCPPARNHWRDCRRRCQNTICWCDGRCRNMSRRQSISAVRVSGWYFGPGGCCQGIDDARSISSACLSGLGQNNAIVCLDRCTAYAVIVILGGLSSGVAGETKPTLASARAAILRTNGSLSFKSVTRAGTSSLLGLGENKTLVCLDRRAAARWGHHPSLRSGWLRRFTAATLPQVRSQLPVPGLEGPR